MLRASCSAGDMYCSQAFQAADLEVAWRSVAAISMPPAGSFRSTAAIAGFREAPSTLPMEAYVEGGRAWRSRTDRKSVV